MGRETAMELERPSTIAKLLWAFGTFITALTAYSIIDRRGGRTTHHTLLIFFSLSSGINATATGVPIDMHTTQHKTEETLTNNRHTGENAKYTCESSQNQL